MTGLRERAAEGLQVGDSFRTTRTFTDDEVTLFAKISRDYNPIHFDARFAEVKKFPAVICHGLLTASLVTEIGGQIGWLASFMNFRFKGPVYVGETITCNWVITVIDQKGRAKASFTIIKGDGVTVIEGEIGGIIPGLEERKILHKMLSEGDPTNGIKGGKMSKLFESTTINGMKLKNRFVRSATYEAMAGLDGSVTEKLLNCMAELARGEVGLIITGHTHVTKEGQAGPRQMGIYSDEMIEGLKQLTSTVHENGGLVAAQLAHAGMRGIGKGDAAPLGPSDVVQDGDKKASAMTENDIQRTVKAFGDAAKRAVQADFDAIEIHAAHGYLLSQFLSPYYNRRRDNYGGSLENRAKLLIKVYEEIRQQVGNSFPVLIKINSEDFLDGGMTLAETIKVCHMLEDRGMNAIEMSGGTFESGKLIPSRIGTSKSEDREVYYRKAAEIFKKEIGTPLILVGGFLSFNIAEEVITSGLADYVALARPLIREPDLIKRWSKGDLKKASCISCNKCFSTLFMKEALHCAAKKKQKGVNNDSK